MPRTTTTSAARTNQEPPLPPDVLTLSEAAAYLRVPEDDVLQMVREQGLPARKIKGQWRFLKSALQDWLRAPLDPTRDPDFWERHFGALKDDPYLEEMLRDIYKRRGRPETED